MGIKACSLAFSFQEEVRRLGVPLDEKRLERLNMPSNILIIKQPPLIALFLVCLSFHLLFFQPLNAIMLR